MYGVTISFETQQLRKQQDRNSLKAAQAFIDRMSGNKPDTSPQGAKQAWDKATTPLGRTKKISASEAAQIVAARTFKASAAPAKPAASAKLGVVMKPGSARMVTISAVADPKYSKG